MIGKIVVAVLVATAGVIIYRKRKEIRRTVHAGVDAALLVNKAFKEAFDDAVALVKLEEAVAKAIDNKNQQQKQEAT